MMNDIILNVENVSKIFKVPNRRYDTLREEFINFWKFRNYHNFTALKDISFEVKRGEFFSIIGRNGSGKSTLLKIISGIYTPNTGRIESMAEISPFISLGIGFNPELSARDNIYINGVVLGLPYKEIKRRFEEIINFAEIADFVDTKLKFFSSGMLVRLAFSLAIQTTKEILIFDEILAVGDAKFQNKCTNVIENFINSGKTIIFVSHGMADVEKYSNRVMILHQGGNKFIGNPKEAVDIYKELNF